MALIQKSIFVLCIASVYAASITNMSEENFSVEMEDTPITKNSGSNLEKNEGQISDYDPITPSLVVSESNGLQVGKSLVETILGMYQIVRHMDLSPEGLKNVSLLLTSMLSVFAGRYYETLKNVMPLFSGIAMAILEALR